jgi:hypothetical protein
MVCRDWNACKALKGFSLAVVDAGHIVKSTGWCTKPLETLWSLDNSGTQTQKELREIHYQ